MQKYPKCLYGKQGLDNLDDIKIVFDEVEETEAKNNGFCDLEVVEAEKKSKPDNSKAVK